MRLIFALVAFFAASVVAAPPPLIPDPSEQECSKLPVGYCPPDRPKGGSDTNICKDKRLGPVTLPSSRIFDWLLTGYDKHQFGGLCPSQFITQYWNYSITPVANSTWAYPKYDGFALDVNNNPIRGVVKLEPGLLIDRFGLPSGHFLAAVDALFIQRALPPDVLNYGIGNYHVYNVSEPGLYVEEGPSAPWFGQLGHGTQFQLLENKTVAEMISNKTLVEVNLANSHVAEVFMRERLAQAKRRRSTYF